MRARILLVDDDPLVGKLFCTALHQQGFDPYAVQSGTDALAYLDEHEVDLVILDVMMADMSGISVVEQIRARPALNDLPIIVLSARVDTESRLRGLQAGANEYLLKPITPADLVEHIRSQLA
ncbi:MAG: response regulator transcription factor [Anaerolineae bacterium]|nr:response regulator transcription factor [Anaerolineae bacterium]